MRKVAVVVLAMALLMMFAALTPVFAKNFNLPEDVSRIYYSSGEGVVETPTNWPPGGAHQNELYIIAQQVEAGTLGSGGDSIVVCVRWPTADGFIWLPIVYLTTNSPAVSFAKTLLSGMPVSVFPLNAKVVSDSVLKVERHGNSITAKLSAPQTVLWFTPDLTGVVPAIIPVFTMEVDKVEGSFHDEDSSSYTGFPDASEYTVYEDEMGFRAQGVFTCSGWNSDMSNCWIMKHGITTYVPP